MAAVYQLKINYDQDKFRMFFLDAKRPVSFPLEDKHVVNEHHVMRKSLDATQKKNVLTWCIFSMYHVNGLKQTCGIKSVTLKAAKHSWVSRFTGKGNTFP